MLKINEIFGPTVQGEGKSTGLPVAFIRLAMCNLYCVWCDTPYTWNWVGTKFEHPDKYEKKDEVHPMSVDDIMTQLKQIDVKAVVISGGEPLVQHKALLPLLKELKANGYWTEVETNGTILPTQTFFDYVDQVNVSPKLANSGNSLKDRRVSKAMFGLAQLDNANFKFVVANDEDLQEVLELVNEFDLRDVYLMPEGRTKEEVESKTQWVRDVCNEHNFHFTSRIHITLGGGGRGV